MKAVILCGGKGTRLQEETEVIPKPLLMVGDMPMLQHIMNCYMAQGIDEFILPIGYKGYHIIAYFLSLNPLSFLSLDARLHMTFANFTVTIVDTGLDTQTGGRLKRIRTLLGNDPFFMTYGDGLSNADLMIPNLLLSDIGCEGVITLVHPVGRFGMAKVHSSGKITSFGEKIESSLDWVNGGFAALSPSIIDKYIYSDSINLERDVYPAMARKGKLFGYMHEGFWHCVDTLRDLRDINRIYEKEGAVWLK